MPYTTLGTEYTTVEFTPPGGSLSLWAAPTSAVGGAPVNMLIYCHGSAGDHNDLAAMPAWRQFRHLLIDNGWGWVESLAYDPVWAPAVNNYGAPTGVAHYLAAYERAASDLNINRTAVAGRSMGGMAAMRIFLGEGFPHAVDSLIQVCAVQNFTDWVMARGKGQFRLVYGYPTDDALVADLPNIDPSRYPLEMWEGKRVLQVVGDADDLVPPAEHGLMMRTRLHDVLAVSALSVAHGGGHGEDGGYTKGQDMIDFLQDFGGKKSGSPVTAIRAGFQGEAREVIEVAVKAGGVRRPVKSLAGLPGV